MVCGGSGTAFSLLLFMTYVAEVMFSVLFVCLFVRSILSTILDKLSDFFIFFCEFLLTVAVNFIGQRSRSGKIPQVPFFNFW